jgi:hypothetical protein
MSSREGLVAGGSGICAGRNARGRSDWLHFGDDQPQVNGGSARLRQALFLGADDSRGGYAFAIGRRAVTVGELANARRVS